MQLFAYNNHQIVCAEDALKGKNYSCPECLGTLRVKESINCRKHFFHLSHTQSCRQSQKDEIHLSVQKAFISQLPQGEVILEKPFHSIQRIADLAWISRKIVFEIQCSPISLKEVQDRNTDYAKMGYEVIWILHDKLFNRKMLSAAEVYLRGQRSYFTNIDSDGKGTIYNQDEAIHLNRRLFKGEPLPISLKNPLKKRSSLKTSPAKTSYFQSLKTFYRLFFLHLIKKISH